MSEPMTEAEVVTFAALVDSYESDVSRDAMGLPAGYGVVNLETVRRLLATIRAARVPAGPGYTHLRHVVEAYVSDTPIPGGDSPRAIVLAAIDRLPPVAAAPVTPSEAAIYDAIIEWAFRGTTGQSDRAEQESRYKTLAHQLASVGTQAPEPSATKLTVALSRSAVLGAIRKKLPALSRKQVAANLEMMGADLVEAYRMGTEEAQSCIYDRIAAMSTLEAS